MITPSKEQTLQFLNYFISRHSWYKHLSWETPVDFVFFLDDSAWMNVNVLNVKGLNNSFLDLLFTKGRKKEKEKIVVTESSLTNTMREKYGNWNFNGGRIRGMENDIESTYIINGDLKMELLNPEKIEYGKIGLTAFIHPFFLNEAGNKDFRAKHIREIEKLKNHLLSIINNHH